MVVNRAGDVIRQRSLEHHAIAATVAETYRSGSTTETVFTTAGIPGFPLHRLVEEPDVPLPLQESDMQGRAKQAGSC